MVQDDIKGIMINIFICFNMKINISNMLIVYSDSSFLVSSMEPALKSFLYKKQSNTFRAILQFAFTFLD